MPNLTVSLTNAQWSRVEAAFPDREGNPPTAADIERWIRRQIRDRVLRNELGRASALAEDQKRTELQTEGW